MSGAELSGPGHVQEVQVQPEVVVPRVAGNGTSPTETKVRPRNRKTHGKSPAEWKGLLDRAVYHNKAQAHDAFFQPTTYMHMLC